jgi:hypothetical protein
VGCGEDGQIGHLVSCRPSIARGRRSAVEGGDVRMRPAAIGPGVCGRREDCAGRVWPQRSSAKVVARLRPAGATGHFHLAPADRGDLPRNHCALAAGRIAPSDPPEGGGLIPTVQIHGASSGRFRAGTPAPRRELWPLAARRRPRRFGGPRPRQEHPAGRNFGKVGATPTIRSHPREPFARDPVQRGGSAGKIRWGQVWGDKFYRGQFPP